jgi:hypothetical protein
MTVSGSNLIVVVTGELSPMNATRLSRISTDAHMMRSLDIIT